MAELNVTYSIDMSQECIKVLTALLVAQGSFHSIIRTESNPFFHSKYAPLEGIIDAVKQSLIDAGILVFQDVVNDTMRTRLIHSSGEWIIGYYPFVQGKTKTDKKTGESSIENESQTVGAAHTYARRYSLMGMFFLGADDDDGETAAGRPPQKEKPETPAGPPTEAQGTAEDELKKTLMKKAHALALNKGLDHDRLKAWCKKKWEGFESMTMLTTTQLRTVIDALEKYEPPQ